MEHEKPKIIDELKFVLTHPQVSVQHLEQFYINSLYLYDAVPLFSIVDYIKKSKPQLLKEWSDVNTAVRSLLLEFESDQEELPEKQTIIIRIDLEGVSPTAKGIYQIPWETEIEEPIINAHFKTKSLRVIDKHAGQLKVVGISQRDSNLYHLYVKKGGK